jgi:hypothetical protein
MAGRPGFLSGFVFSGGWPTLLNLIYAMNTLLIHKGIYTREEFQTLFVEWVAKEQQKDPR